MPTIIYTLIVVAMFGVMLVHVSQIVSDGSRNTSILEYVGYLFVAAGFIPLCWIGIIRLLALAGGPA